MTKEFEADYVIVGAGASGMAFADIILSESQHSIIVIDKHHKPGGHWNNAYSFVTLHQPSSFYGVASKELSKGLKDKTGWNKGLNELASGAEVQAYFDDVMRETFLPSGRVEYFPMCEYLGNGEVQSLLTGERFVVKHRKKLVDSTYFKTAIPATHTPAFSVSPDVRFMPPNNLPHLSQPVGGFVIVGGGKTAIDTVLWLLQHQIDPDQITWIMPRDAWLLDRNNTQPTKEFFEASMGTQAKQFEAIAAADSIDDMFLRLEKAGVFVRIDQEVMPVMFHGATISTLELEQLRRVKHIVRLGRVTAIEGERIVLEQGEIPTSSDKVHVDCTASAITNLDISPVFEGDRVTIQTVRAYQPTFSAAFIAHIEVTYQDNEKKNQLCKVVPLPNGVNDWIDMTYRNLMNQYFWSKEPGLKKWLLGNRLDGFMHLVNDVKFYELDKLKILNRMRKAAKPAVAKLKAFKEQLDAASD